MDHLCYLCFVFVIAALWSPPGTGLTSWLLFVMFNCVFVTFPCGIMGQVWYLIVSIPNLCHLSYFNGTISMLFWFILICRKQIKLLLGDKVKFYYRRKIKKIVLKLFL